MASAALGAAYRHLRDLFGGGTVIGLADGQLLARYASSKDGAAFEALVSRHGPMVLATCRAILKNEHDVEDAFQATFLVLARRAGSIQSGDALGGWLHRVAYRSAVQASLESKRRRRKEAEAQAMRPPDASRPDPAHDLGPILHEEVNRLPESHRLAVVLCDLEGLTYEQAAQQLRWTVPTLRCRLAKARQRLRDRLTRRGLDASALPLAIAPPAIVPPSLLMATVAAATGGPVPAGTALLTHLLLKGMLMSRIKIASTAALAALGLATAGLIAAGSGRPDDPGPAMRPAPTSGRSALQAAAPPPGAPEPVEMLEVRGIVLAPDGRPVAGARVRLAQIVVDEVPDPAEVLSQPDGRFAIKIPRSVRERFAAYIARFPRLVATAPGYGPGWVEGIFRADAPAEQRIALVEPGPEIEGRVVDPEGRPVAGARVEARDLWYAGGGDLAPWIASARAGGIQGIGRELRNLRADPPATATTDLQGRFRLPGQGRERVAGLLLSGPTIATETLYVMGRDEPEVRTVDKSWAEPRPFLVHAPRFQHAAAPARTVEGVIRDRDTGRPIAGVTIQGNIDRKSDLTTIDGIDARTDDRGRYRLTGLPRAAGYRIFLAAPDGAPYPNASFVVPATAPAPDPVLFDVALKRGVIVRGRVTDKVTGRPVMGRVEAYTFADNPLAKDYPGYSEGDRSGGLTGSDGRFEAVAIPGRGLIAVRSDDALYRGGVGAREIEGPRLEGHGDEFDTLPGPCRADGYHTLAGLDLDPRVESVTRDLQVEPGRSIRVTVVDPEGLPVRGAKALGLGDIYPFPRLQESPTFEVHALDPSRPRRLTITHEGRKLVGSAYLKGDEPDALTVRLQPWGVISGRVLDAEGRPRPGLSIFTLGGILLEHPEEQGVLPFRDGNAFPTTDADGRFRIEGLVPGLKYGGTASDGFKGLGGLFRDFVVKPGEVIELGELRPAPRGE